MNGKKNLKNTTTININQNKMADIAKCNHKTCPKRKTCFRQIAKANDYWQSYGSFHPDKDGNCDFYWPFTCKFCGKKGEHTEECKLNQDD